MSLVDIWVPLVIWVPLFLGLPGVQGPASPVAIWACCPLRHARLVPGHLPTTGIMPLHVRHTNTTTVIGHGLSLLMHRIAQIVDGKLDTPLVFPSWDDSSCDRRVTAFLRERGEGRRRSVRATEVQF